MSLSVMFVTELLIGYTESQQMVDNSVKNVTKISKIIQIKKKGTLHICIVVEVINRPQRGFISVVQRNRVRNYTLYC